MYLLIPLCPSSSSSSFLSMALSFVIRPFRVSFFLSLFPLPPLSPHWLPLPLLRFSFSCYCSSSSSSSSFSSSWTESLILIHFGILTPPSALSSFWPFVPLFQVTLPERFSQRWIPKLQFWYPPLRFRSQVQIPEPLFLVVLLVYTADIVVFFLAARGQFFLGRLSPNFGSQHQLRIKNPPSNVLKL